jgi:hypothetical protein
VRVVSNNQILQLEESINSSLGLVVGIIEIWRAAAAPRVLVGNTPAGNSNALGHGKTGLGDSDVCISGCTCDVELSDRYFIHTGCSKCRERGLNTAGQAEMGLRTDALDKTWVCSVDLCRGQRSHDTRGQELT